MVLYMLGEHGSQEHPGSIPGSGAYAFFMKDAVSPNASSYSKANPKNIFSDEEY